MSTKTKPVAPDDAIARVIDAGRDVGAVTGLWLDTLRHHEAALRTKARSWGDGPEERARLYRLACADHAATKLARGNGETLPARPFRDELEERTAMATSTRATTSNASDGSGGGGKRGRSVDYYVGGKKITRRYFLGFMANDETKGIVRPERMSTAEFRSLLAAAGVNEPEHSTWQLELPNGRVIGAALPGQELPAAKKVSKDVALKVKIDGPQRGVKEGTKAEKSAKVGVTKVPRKAVTKEAAKAAAAPKAARPQKASAAKARTTRDAAKASTAAGRRALARKDVTPIPKKQAAKSA